MEKDLNNKDNEKIEDDNVSTGKPIDEEPIVKKEPSLFRKMFLHSLVKYIVSLIIGIILVITTLSIKGFSYLVSYEDAFFIAGAVVIFIGILSLLSNYGAFDLLAYSGKYVYNMSKKRKVERYPDYVENKIAIRKKMKYKWIPYVVVGCVFIIIAIIFMIIVNQMTSY